MALTIDDRRTWPRSVRDEVRDHAARLRGTTGNTTDLRIGREEEDGFRSRLPAPIRAYHATRLLDHEVDSIRSVGLVELTEDLAVRRVEDAHGFGYLTVDQRDALLRAHVFAEDDAENRERQVCVFLSRRELDHDVAAVWPLLTTWGGEGIYMSSGGGALRPLLRELGQPAIVVVDVGLAEPWSVQPVWPGLLHSFVGRELGFDEWGCEAFLGGSVPAECVVDIWTPGHPEFDRHAELLEAI